MEFVIPLLRRRGNALKRAALAIFVVILAVAAVFVWRMTQQPPRVPVHRVARSLFEDQITTNGRVEPIEWGSARAERDGLVIQLPAQNGKFIARGAPLAVLDSREAQADLAAAMARINEAQAQLKLLESGGRQREQVDIEQSLRQRKAELAQTESELAMAERLLSRNAGTRESVRKLIDQVELLRLQIDALEARRPTLVAPADLAAARARLREANSAADLARRRIEVSTIRSPLSGVVYQLEARLGSYLSPGSLVANVGRLDTVKVLVFVDEPELGRVQQGMPVKITWDALENKSWSGLVDKVPTQILPLGSRQVGEVECTIQNPNRQLLPGTNVNAFLSTRREENALLVPKDGIRIVNGEQGVYLLKAGKLTWQKISRGPGNITSSIVTAGLAEGDLVALGPDANFRPGTLVKPVEP